MFPSVSYLSTTVQQICKALAQILIMTKQNSTNPSSAIICRGLPWQQFLVLCAFYCNALPTVGLDVHWLSVPPFMNPHLSPPFSSAVHPLQLLSGAPWTWTEESIGSAEKGLRDAVCRIHWQKRAPMPVWRPPPGLPECEWTSVNEKTYSNARCYRTFSRGKSAWAMLNSNNNQGIFLPGFKLSLLLHPIKKSHKSQGGPQRMGRWQKLASQGVSASPSQASMDVSQSSSPHIAINTYSTNRQQQRNLPISISKTDQYKSIKVQCVFQTASFPHSKIKKCMTSLLTRQGGGKQGANMQKRTVLKSLLKRWLQFTLKMLGWAKK